MFYSKIINKNIVFLIIQYFNCSNLIKATESFSILKKKFIDLEIVQANYENDGRLVLWLENTDRIYRMTN